MLYFMPYWRFVELRALSYFLVRSALCTSRYQIRFNPYLAFVAGVRRRALYVGGEQLCQMLHCVLIGENEIKPRAADNGDEVEEPGIVGLGHALIEDLAGLPRH